MRARWFALASVVTSLVFVACVGDDPAPNVANSSNDAGSGGVDSSNSNPGNDSGNVDIQPDGGNGNDAGDAGPAFEVTAMSGLRLWLESTRALTKASVGSDIVSWVDSSGRNAGSPHTATPVAYNGGGAVYPNYVPNGINGRPVVGFSDGTKFAIPNHTDFEFGTGDLVVAAVGTVSTGSGPFWRLMTATTAPQGTYLGGDNACTFMGALGADPKCTSPSYSPNTSPHVFVLRRKAAQMIFRVDGTSRGTYDFGVDNPNLTVFDYQQESVFVGGALTGQLAELVVVIGATSDADLDKLETHLKSKYGLQ